MRELAPPLSKTTVYVRLGRVSNLPTVWTNASAALVLSGAALDVALLLPLGLALSAFYVGGMFLNDAFDRDIDAQARPERPIPSGLIPAAEVFALGFLFLCMGWGAMTVLAGSGHPHGAQAALALLIAIVLYDAWHRHAAASLVMGACRGLVYLSVGLTVGNAIPAPLALGAVMVTVYVTALSVAAKHWPLAHRFVARLIAGIALLDASLVLSQGHVAAAALTALGFPATLLLQRWVRGT